MAKRSATTDHSAWDACFLDYAVAFTAAESISDHPPCASRKRIVHHVAEALEAIKALTPPTFVEIINKLRSLWGDQLFGDDADASIERRIIGDLFRIGAEHAGIEEPEASERMDPDTISRDWQAASARFISLENSSSAIHSANCSFGENVENRVRSAEEAHLLSLPAPDLEAVLGKLRVLWFEDRFAPPSQTLVRDGILFALGMINLRKDQ